MPIHGRTPRECFEFFAGHIRSLIANTVTNRYPLQMIGSARDDSVRVLSFMESRGAIAVPVETRYGKLFLHLAQSLCAEHEEETKRYRLTTQQYWYRVQRGPRLDEQALIRWEYSTRERGQRPARHHVQQRTIIEISDGHALDMNKVHLPTGWVTIEEVIRFLITDLGMKPICGGEWVGLLEASEQKFFEDFTSKRYLPAG